jgi:hypothetical protein
VQRHLADFGVRLSEFTRRRSFPGKGFGTERPKISIRESDIETEVERSRVKISKRLAAFSHHVANDVPESTAEALALHSVNVSADT